MSQTITIISDYFECDAYHFPPRPAGLHSEHIDQVSEQMKIETGETISLARERRHTVVQIG